MFLKKSKFLVKTALEGGHMHKFRPQEGCAWCVHILGMERDCLLGSFKVIKCILDRFCARGYSARPPRPKSANFRPKIADLQKFRCRNFGRGVSGAVEKNFLNYKIALLPPKKCSWSYENFKFVFQKFLGGGETVPPSTFFTRI